MSVVEMKVPSIGESITEVTLSEWLVKEGDYVELDQPICEFESDKATLEFPAEAAGVIKYVAGEGDDLEIGALVATIDTSAEKPAGSAPSAAASSAPDPAPSAPASAPATASQPMKHVASPAAAKIMREHGMSSQHVSGSGKDGRITKEDAIAASASPAPQKSPESKQPQPKKENAAPQVIFNSGTFSREERVEKMSRMRRTIATRLVSAKNETAMLTTFNEVDLTNIIALRKKYQDDFVNKYGVKLGFMSIFAKACAQVLIQMPQVNAQISDNNLIFHDYVDISFAISTPTGLVVPPIRNIESLHYAEIELKLKELAAKARDGSLTLQEMQGGTFTITNGGVFGSMMSTPIINQPQSAILGMHTIKQRPIAVDGEVKIRPMMYLALSYDHRVIDGSSSVTFLVNVIKLLEDPVKLLMRL